MKWTRSISRANAMRYAGLLITLGLMTATLQPAGASHIGGGLLSGGILGQYYNNTTLSGTPSFTRRDVRVDFNFGTSIRPGGSDGAGYRDIGTQNWSARWTGTLMSRFTETYTFSVRSAAGARLYLRPTSSSTWTKLIDDWTPHTGTTDKATSALLARTSYDIRLEYLQTTGPAAISLHWYSPSTPDEVIEAASSSGVNGETYMTTVYADRQRRARDEWRDIHFNNLIPRDTLGWPTQDGSCLIWEGIAHNDGSYLVQFNGKAQVFDLSNNATFSIGGKSYGNTLPVGAGYNASTNTTTATMSITDKTPENFGLVFQNSQRTAGSAVNTGITNLKVMRPVSEGSTTSYSPYELFTNDARNAFSRFTTIRWLTANYNHEQNWSDRTPPNYATGQRAKFGNGYDNIPWEYLVRMSNETGKDLYLTVPELATGASATDTSSYLYQLAQLIRNGDTVVGVPYYGLNPNLNLYLEYSNEVWNYGFDAWNQNFAAAQVAINNKTPEGAILTFDGDSDQNVAWTRRQALRAKQMSDIFRGVWGDALMPGGTAEPRVRPILEWQYDDAGWPDTAGTELTFLDQYFNNGDGKNHVANPHPVSYYLYGGGGATYFDGSTPDGAQTATVFVNPSFELNGGWSFTGKAGIAANGSIPGQPSAPDGTHAAYITGVGTLSQAINFARSGVYTVSFQCAGIGDAPAFDIYLDGKRITPPQYAGDNPVQPGPNSYSPNTSYAVVGSAPFTISSVGNHTVKLVGASDSMSTCLFDQMQILNADAIFAGDLPATADNTDPAVNQKNYSTLLATEAAWAKRFGLKEISYEGGWGLGGDGGGSTIQNYCKYVAPRSVQVQLKAIRLFNMGGSDLQLFGTYDTWFADDTAHASAYPLVQGTDQALLTLPAEPTAGIAEPGTLLIPANLTLDHSDNAGSLSQGGWIDWNILIPTTGQYTLSASTTTGGQAVLTVNDHSILAKSSSGAALKGSLVLPRGLHTVQVRCLGGSFTVDSVSVTH